MADIKVTVPNDQLQKMLEWMVDQQILTDYHGAYPDRIVLALSWVWVDGGEPRPAVAGVQIGFAAS